MGTSPNWMAATSAAWPHCCGSGGLVRREIYVVPPRCCTSVQVEAGARYPSVGMVHRALHPFEWNQPKELMGTTEVHRASLDWSTLSSFYPIPERHARAKGSGPTRLSSEPYGRRGRQHWVRPRARRVSAAIRTHAHTLKRCTASALGSHEQNDRGSVFECGTRHGSLAKERPSASQLRWPRRSRPNESGEGSRRQTARDIQTIRWGIHIAGRRTLHEALDRPMAYQGQSNSRTCRRLQPEACARIYLTSSGCVPISLHRRWRI